MCFVSTDLRADLAAARKGTHKLEYVLPDGVNERIGYARQPLGKGERAEKNSKEQVRALTRSSHTILVMSVLKICLGLWLPQYLLATLKWLEV